MKIIIAPNSFKGSLDAFQVAKAIEDGINSSRLSAECEIMPIADGGDHTLEVFQRWQGGNIESESVRDPLGREVEANWLYIEEKETAVIEMAKASGISLLREEELDPLKTSSYGTGQLISAAIAQGVKKIILGLGGSATVDAGLGILQALGAQLYDSHGDQISHWCNPLLEIHEIEFEDTDGKFNDVQFSILCDVENPLLGEEGAAHVFGPQKGADPAMVRRLESAMKNFNDIIIRRTGEDLSEMPGAGAAGGIAVTLKAFFSATMQNGVDYLLSNMGFEEKIKRADLLITAEGKVDQQTLQGKGPYGVAKKAGDHGVPSIILAGKADDIEQLNKGFSVVFAITNGPMSLKEAMKNTTRDLKSTAAQIGNLLALSKL